MLATLRRVRRPIFAFQIKSSSRPSTRDAPVMPALRSNRRPSTLYPLRMRLYATLIHAWEARLASVDPYKTVRPFDWGWEWLRHTPVDGLPPAPGGLPDLAAWNRSVLEDSERFYAYPPVTDYQLHGEWLTFSSPAPGLIAENNTVHARWFCPPAGAAARRAVIVLPQWNADIDGHVVLCRALQRMGIAALRLSLPYHDRRRPAQLQRAEYTVDSNVGRTIHAARQAVCEIRACLDWLEARGFRSLGILGTSLGSCYAFLATTHDVRLRVNVFNHVSAFFGDVVWTGMTTQHVRAGLAERLDQDGLREAWRAISPASFYRRMIGTGKKNLMICARYDLSFLPEFSRQVLAEFRRLGIDYDVRWLSCGHYTIGQAPFKYLDAWTMLRYLHRHL